MLVLGEAELKKPSYEYVGYGPSRFKDCVPSERGCYRAINAAWAYLIAHGVDPTTIVIYGRSIGTGPSVDLASRVEAKGLLLQSPIDSAIRCALGYGSSLALRPVWKSNHDLHAIDATPARWRGGVDSSPLDGASTAACTRHNG